MAKKPQRAEQRIVREEIEPLPVRLTQDELLEFGQQLAQVEQKRHEHDLHADQVKKDLKAKETALDAERARLASIVRNKAEVRDVPVSVVHDYAANEAQWIRSDNGELINRRPLAPNERQIEFEVVRDPEVEA